jgi:hypothetical protein
VDVPESFRLLECLPDMLTSADVAGVQQSLCSILSSPAADAYGQK